MQRLASSLLSLASSVKMSNLQTYHLSAKKEMGSRSMGWGVGYGGYFLSKFICEWAFTHFTGNTHPVSTVIKKKQTTVTSAKDSSLSTKKAKMKHAVVMCVLSACW